MFAKELTELRKCLDCSLIYTYEFDIKKLAVVVLSILLVVSTIGSLFGVYATDGEGTVEWVYEDTETKGDWMGLLNPVGSPICTYGSYAHILPNAPAVGIEIPVGELSVPIGEGFDWGDDTTWHLLYDDPYFWDWNQVNGLPWYRSDPPYWDEYVTQIPEVTYQISGTYVEDTGVQYPAFEWGGSPWHATQTDPREVYYTTNIPDTDNPDPPDGDGLGGPGWRFASWDDGGERCTPEHGYIDFTLTFPEGTYLLSLYAVGYARASQEYQIYDETGTILLCPPVQISDTVFDEGVYEIFKVEAPYGGLTIIVRVYNDAGHVPYVDPYPEDKTNNVVLSGIFVDKVASETSAIFSCDEFGVAKDSFETHEEVWVMVPSLDRWVDIYIEKDRLTWEYDAPLDGAYFIKKETIELGEGNMEKHWLWGPGLIVGEYDIIMDVNQDGKFNEGDLIDHCNEITGFFVIPELAMGTLGALLSTIVALTIFKRKRK